MLYLCTALLTLAADAAPLSPAPVAVVAAAAPGKTLIEELKKQADAGNADALLAGLDRAMLVMMEARARRDKRQLAQMIKFMVPEYQSEAPGEGDQAGKIIVTLKHPAPANRQAQAVLEKGKDGRWRMIDLIDNGRAMSDQLQPSALKQSQAKFQAVKKALEDKAAEEASNQYPAELGASAEAVPQAVPGRQFGYLATISELHGPLRYAGNLDLAGSESQLLLAADSRLRDEVFTLTAGGTFAVMKPAEFDKLAAQQKFGIAKAAKVIDDAMHRQVAAAVKKLGGGPTERRQAKKELLGLGKTALPALQGFRRDEDPQIRLEVEELIGKIKAK